MRLVRDDHTTLMVAMVGNTHFTLRISFNFLEEQWKCLLWRVSFYVVVFDVVTDVVLLFGVTLGSYLVLILVCTYA